jgi:hypothetical protein
MINEAKLPNKWLSALLPVLLVLSLAACSSSDEQSSDTSGETPDEECPGGGPRGDEGVCCDFDMMQPGCPAM